MRKVILLLAGVILAGAFTAAPARADVGCGCVKMGAAMCVSGIAECAKSGGVCLAICDYQMPKKAMRRMKKKG